MTLNIIQMTDQADWFTMNMLKKSIAYMEKINKEGKFSEAIDKEKAILRSFFNKASGRSEAEPTEVAA